MNDEFPFGASEARSWLPRCLHTLVACSYPWNGGQSCQGSTIFSEVGNILGNIQVNKCNIHRPIGLSCFKGQTVKPMEVWNAQASIEKVHDVSWKISHHLKQIMRIVILHKMCQKNAYWMKWSSSSVKNSGKGLQVLQVTSNRLVRPAWCCQPAKVTKSTQATHSGICVSKAASMTEKSLAFLGWVEGAKNRHPISDLQQSTQKIYTGVIVDGTVRLWFRERRWHGHHRWRNAEICAMDFDLRVDFIATSILWSCLARTHLNGLRQPCTSHDPIATSPLKSGSVNSDSSPWRFQRDPFVDRSFWPAKHLNWVKDSLNTGCSHGSRMLWTKNFQVKSKWTAVE